MGAKFVRLLISKLNAIKMTRLEERSWHLEHNEHLLRQNGDHVTCHFLIGMTVLILESEFSIIPALQTHQTTTTAL